MRLQDSQVFQVEQVCRISVEECKSNAEYKRLDADHLVDDYIQVSFNPKLYIYML